MSKESRVVLRPQAGPQAVFANILAGTEEEDASNTCPLVFYGGEICASLLGNK